MEVESVEVVDVDRVMNLHLSRGDSTGACGGMVDAADLKSAGLAVRVRVPPRAPTMEGPMDLSAQDITDLREAIKYAHQCYTRWNRPTYLEDRIKRLMLLDGRLEEHGKKES
jgi:hypothetical protein